MLYTLCTAALVYLVLLMLRSDRKERALNLLIALDQFVYVVITLGEGMPDETMSAAAYHGWLLGRPWGFMRRVIDAIFFFDPNHCYQAYLAEIGGQQLPEGERPNVR